MAEMRAIAKDLARRDREARTALVKRRRAAGLKQSDCELVNKPESADGSER